MDTENENEIITVEEYDEQPVEQPTQVDDVLHCDFCSWATHHKTKDKKRGLRNHLKKCDKNPENAAKNKPTVAFFPKDTDEVFETMAEYGKEDEEIHEQLMGDCDLLKAKFSHIDFNWNYTSNSSVRQLKKQKALFLRLLTDSASVDAVFNLVVLGSRAVEKGANVGGVDISGYSEDVKATRDEIYPILKTMVDTGQLNVSILTPELRLGLLLSSLAVSRLETNSLRDRNFLDEPIVDEPDYV